MLCHSDRQYLHHSVLPALIIDFLSQSDENFYSNTFLPKKSRCAILANLPVFEIVFAASIVLYHQCCAALSCTAMPVLQLVLR